MATDEFNKKIQEKIRQAEQQIKAAQTEIDKAEKAGVNVSDRVRELTTKKEQLAQIKAVYAKE